MMAARTRMTEVQGFEDKTPAPLAVIDKTHHLIADC